jgi:hypothetical protein
LPPNPDTVKKLVERMRLPSDIAVNEGDSISLSCYPEMIPILKSESPDSYIKWTQNMEYDLETSQINHLSSNIFELSKYFLFFLIGLFIVLYKSDVSPGMHIDFFKKRNIVKVIYSFRGKRYYKVD